MFIMSQLNPSRDTIFRRVSSSAVVGLLAAVFALLLPAVAALGAGAGAVEINGTEFAGEITKTEKTVESLSKRTASRNTKPAAWLRATRREGRDCSHPRPRHFHDRHSLPNGLRAPLLC